MPLHFADNTSNTQLYSTDCVISPNQQQPQPWASWVKHELNLEQAQIMIIDDEPVVLNVLRRQLQDFGCENIVICSDSTKALELLRKLSPDLLLLDMVMPGMSGLDILKAIRSDEEYKLLPVLIMTASSDPETKILSLLSGGATDYLRKPLEMTEVLPSVRNALIVKKHQDENKKYVQCLEQQAQDLERQVELRTQELISAWQDAVKCLARAGEYRDDDTGQHVYRVGQYVAIIANRLGLRESEILVLEPAAQLHDVGKIGISDTILLKPGKLTEEEFDIMKNHCEFGRNILSDLKDDDDNRAVATSPVIQMAAVIAASHHEWWDGSGYPYGLKGTEIPLPGRITAVADVYDALSSKRPYKDPMPHEKCLQIIREERGSHFDPTVVDAFLACSDEVLEIRNKYSDAPIAMDLSSD